MSQAPVVAVSKLLDERGVGPFQIKLLIWSALIVLIDGYDLGVIAFAAPSLVKEWGLDRNSLGPVFSASLVGILIGSAIFGWIGDNHGRKAALIGSLISFGLFTWISAYSSNIEQMFWLRLIAGIGIGGVIPNIVAINAESAPRSSRAILALIAVSLVPIGAAIPGVVTAFLVPHYGWQILFILGGIGPIALGVIAFFALSESIKFMALHERQRGRMEKLIAEIRPDVTVPKNAKFVIEDEKQVTGFGPIELFRDGLWLITPLLWLLFALNLMGYYFLLSWTPTLLTAAKLPPATAALAGVSMQVGGTVGSLLMSRWLAKRRFRAITILFVFAVPLVGSIGYTGATSETALMIAIFLAGFCVLGIQSGINVLGALIYPTSLRANGSGWQLGIGRLGSIVGPLLGALFVALPVQQLYMWAALPFAVAAVISFIIFNLIKARMAARPWLGN